MTNAEIREAAIRHVETCFFERTGKRLVLPSPGETGFDRKTEDGSAYREIKGTTKRRPGFRHLTADEIAAASAKRERWWLDLVEVDEATGEAVCHYQFTAEDVCAHATPTGQYALTLRRSLLLSRMVHQRTHE